MNPVLAQIEELMTVAAACRPMASAVEASGCSLASVLAKGGKILTCGNGGSATDATHLSEELVGRFNGERRSLPALSLSTDAALVTCICNDYGWEAVFSRQVEGLGNRGDALVVFSTSGNSINIVRALEIARQRGLITVAVLGKTGGKCKGLANHELIVPSSTTARIQEIHTFILHAWLGVIEGQLGMVS